MWPIFVVFAPPCCEILATGLSVGRMHKQNSGRKIDRHTRWRVFKIKS